MLRSVHRPVRFASALLFLAMTAGCGGSSETSEPAAVPAISISLLFSGLSMPQGQVGSTGVTLTRLNGFTGPVVVTVEGLPAGATGGGPTIAAGATLGTISIQAGTAAVGTTRLTIRATGAGVAAVTLPFDLTITAPPSGGFTMTMSPTAATVAQGGSTTATITIARTAPFTGPVTLSGVGLPAGVTVSFNPASVTGTTSTVTIAAAATASNGGYVIPIVASGSGVENRSVSFALTVNGAAATGGFTLALAPAGLTVQQGSSSSSTVTVTRSGNFTGPVALSATGLPAGVTAVFNPASVTATTSTLTLTAAGTATAGSATVSISGTGTGVAAQTASLTVSGGGGGAAGNVTIAFCPLVGAPVWVAFQDGPGGSWVRSSAANGVYSGQVNSGRGAIAYVTPVAGGGFQTSVRYGTTAELQAFGEIQCFGTTGLGKSVNLSVTGVGIAETALVGLGTSSATAVSLGQKPVTTLENVPDGTLDLIASRMSVNANEEWIVNKLFAQRSITPAAGSTVTVDFNSANAVNPATATLTIANLGIDNAQVLSSYRTANRTFMPYAFDNLSTSASRRIFGFPSAVAGSFHLVQVIAPGRVAAVALSAVSSKTVTLGPLLGAVSVTVASRTPAVRLQAVIPTAAPYNQFWTFAGSQGNAATYRGTIVYSTAAYAGTLGAAVTVAMPDLSGADSYQTDWGMKVGQFISWQAYGQSQTGFGARGELSDGAVSQSSGVGNTITP